MKWVLRLILSGALLCVATRVISEILYRHRISRLLRHRQIGSGRSGSPILSIAPPTLPYWIPFFGHSFALVRSPTARAFWEGVRRGSFGKMSTSARISSADRHIGVTTLVLAGRRAHVVFGPVSAAAVLRIPSLSRKITNIRILTHALGLPQDEAARVYDDGGAADCQTNTWYLLDNESVAELMAKYTAVLHAEIGINDVDKATATLDINCDADGSVVGLYAWLLPKLFRASVTAFMGSRLVEWYPDFCNDFLAFERNFLALFIGLPEALVPGARAKRSRILDLLEPWERLVAYTDDDKDGLRADPDHPLGWDALYGSRHARSRQRRYAQCGLEARSRAAMDAGWLFGLVSNAIPAVAWTLFHILDPREEEAMTTATPTTTADSRRPGSPLLPRILEEVRSAVLLDGSLDIGVLLTQPLLQAALHETLRLYTDVMVARDLHEDLEVPVSRDGNTRVVLRGGDLILVSSCLAHYNPETWSSTADGHEEPDVESYHPERFLFTNPETDAETFRLGGVGGMAPGAVEARFFPFGGSKAMCPGRVFAKQEILTAVASVLLSFDFEVLSFLDEVGRDVENFPRPRPCLPGSGVLAPGGDMKVRVRRRPGGLASFRVTSK